jgi:large subunit ribosomal protein L4
VSTIDVLDVRGEKAGTVDLPEDIFGTKINIPLIHQVVVAQLAARRQGTHKAKTRGEVRGGGKKPYRQKGTGRARQGSVRAPQFTGGGTVHGPTPRDYEQRTPKKMKAAALRGALSDRARHERIHVFSALVDGANPSTKGAKTALASVVTADRVHQKVLAVVAREDVAGRRSLANLPSVHLLTPDQLNTYDVLRADDVVFTTAALEAFVAARTGSAKESDQ